MPLLKSADWPLLIDLYFFLGGVAGGAFVIATIAHLFGGERYRSVVRVGYYLALLTILPGPIFLIVDLGMPTRFLNMLMSVKPDTAIGEQALLIGPFHLKFLSPMSVGSWALLVFSAFAFLAALAVFLEDTRPGRKLSSLKTGAGIIGSLFGFFIAAYPGVLLGATARPLFVNAHFLGALFLAVGAATGGAAIALVLSVAGGESGEALRSLKRTIVYALVIEAVVLIGFLASTGSAGMVSGRALAVLISGSYSLAFWIGAVIIGLVLPLLIEFRSGLKRPSAGLTLVSSLLVLIGGFVVKYVIIAAGQVML
jgi:formate-dependent nitrite reductase membrane component NrfD